MSGFNINRVFLAGNLTRDPELRSLPSGTSVCDLGIAVNERRKDSNGEWSDRPNYFRVSAFTGVGEWIGANLHKGDQVVIEGRLRWHQWEADGVKREAVDVVLDSIIPPRGERRQAEDVDVPIDTRDMPPVAATSTADDNDIPFAVAPVPLDFEPWHAHANR